MTEPGTRAELESRARTAAQQREYERRSVAGHYDQHPEIFSLVLDSGLGYEAGIFEAPGDDLETAQARKYARVAELLGIAAGERVLDVGCGWGSILLHLAEHSRGLVQGITLSPRQREFVLARARERGVADRVGVDVVHVEEFAVPQQSLDAVLFVGSIVHMHNRESIYRRMAEALRPGGRLLVSDCFFPGRARGDRMSAATHFLFVESLGYCRLLTLSEELALMEDAGLDVVRVEDLTTSYNRTLGAWIDNIRRHRERIDELSPGFARVLQTDFTVAKLSFDRRTALEYMILAVKPAAGPRRERSGS